MTKTDAPEGQLFSRTYLERSEPTRDSIRFRTRLRGYFYQFMADHIETELANAITVRLGVTVGWRNGSRDFTGFFLNAELRDVLDTISLIVQVLQKGYPGTAVIWIQFVQDVFNEENLGYRIDSKGGVHYVVDEEFERNRVSAIGSLTAAKYSAAAKCLETAFSRLDTAPIDTKTAIRDTFRSRRARRRSKRFLAAASR